MKTNSRKERGIVEVTEVTEVTIKLTYARDNEGFVKDINIISNKELTKLERIILQQSFREPMKLKKENEGL